MCYNIPMENGSNKGIYIFWGIIVFVIIAVVLFFIIPRTDYALAYNSHQNVIKNTAQQDDYDKTLTDYVDAVQSKFGGIVSSSLMNSLTALETAQMTFALSDDYASSALVFVEKNNQYVKLSRSQAKVAKSLNKKINSFQDYCKTTLKNALNQINLPTTEAESVVLNFNQKYFDLLKKYAEFYAKTAEVIEKSSLKSMQNNLTVISAHKNIIQKVQTELNAELISLTNLTSNYNLALTTYTNDFYLTHFN